MEVVGINRRGTDPDEDPVRVDRRLLDLAELEDVGWAVPVVDDRLHTYSVSYTYSVSLSSDGETARPLEPRPDPPDRDPPGRRQRPRVADDAEAPPDARRGGDIALQPRPEQ